MFGLWHHFYNSPFNVIALQVMAKWFHPDLFKDLKPRVNFEQAYLRFMKKELEGVYWSDLSNKRVEPK